MLIIVKIGTGSVLADNGAALHPAMAGIASDLVALKRDGADPMLVSSGAVGMGRQLMRALNAPNTSSDLPEKQMLSSIGQPALMGEWNSLLRPYGMVGAQVLLTRAAINQRSPLEKLQANLVACHANPPCHPHHQRERCDCNRRA